MLTTCWRPLRCRSQQIKTQKKAPVGKREHTQLNNTISIWLFAVEEGIDRLDNALVVIPLVIVHAYGVATVMDVG